MQDLDRVVLGDLLKRVSRSFFLTLKVLPREVRPQMGLSYLFARAADTIADTDMLDRSRRLLALKRFRDQFASDHVDWEGIRAIQAELLPHQSKSQSKSAERLLFEHLAECFQAYQAFAPEDRQRIRVLMGTLPKGMEMDLTVFPGDSAKELTALQTMADLDRYIYYVAGCVGEFWTEMMCAHLPAFAPWDKARMAPIGIRFGKGLQLTNVLKDLARDLNKGRCYVPNELLRGAGLTPKDLLLRDNRSALRPVLCKLVRVALEHLDQGWFYTMAIPRREVRLRLACMWPILFAGATLQRVAFSPDLLDPTAVVKMPRGQVYRILALTALTAANGSLWTAYWGHLRKQIG